MIRYCPPKSQVWGHRVGRLAATAIVERCSRFIATQCTIIDSQPSELMVGWRAPQDAVLSKLTGEINDALGQPTTVNEVPTAYGGFRQRRWPFTDTNLPTVASWFDRLAELIEMKEVVAQSSTLWMFAWQDEAPPLQIFETEGESAGGMLGIHLGQPHYLTTEFTFRDLAKYEHIKSALRDVHLVELSDKHLRPKIGGATAKRRAR